MIARNKNMSAGELSEVLTGIEGSEDLPVKISSYEGDHGMMVYSVRKHVVTDEEGNVTDAYIVING